MTLQDMQARVRSVNEANGWFESDRSFGDDVALLHSEVSEAFEAYRMWKTEDKTESLCNKGEEYTREDVEGEGPPYLKVNEVSHAGHLCKPEGVGSELADVLVRLFDTCDRYGIDLEEEFERKLAYNATRGYRHGGKNV